MEFVYNDGSSGSFTVKNATTYLEREVPKEVMGLGGEKRTTLITCAGEKIRPNEYDSRLVVILERTHQIAT